VKVKYHQHFKGQAKALGKTGAERPLDAVSYQQKQQ